MHSCRGITGDARNLARCIPIGDIVNLVKNKYLSETLIKGLCIQIIQATSSQRKEIIKNLNGIYCNSVDGSIESINSLHILQVVIDFVSIDEFSSVSQQNVAYIYKGKDQQLNASNNLVNQLFDRKKMYNVNSLGEGLNQFGDPRYYGALSNLQ